MIERVSSDGFAIKCDEHYSSHAFTENFFLDILSDEEEEIPCKICRNRIAWSGKKDDFCSVKHAELYAKPLSFDEPLTKEAVGRWVIDRYHNRRRIIEIALSGEAFRTSLEDGTEAVWTREEAEEKGFAFTTPPEHPDEISIEEAEKLTGKKIKR